MEILRQMPSAPDVVFVPIGGGSLAAGVSTYVKAVNPAVRVVGVQTEDSCAMAQSLRGRAGESGRGRSVLGRHRRRWWARKPSACAASTWTR